MAEDLSSRSGGQDARLDSNADGLPRIVVVLLLLAPIFFTFRVWIELLDQGI